MKLNVVFSNKCWCAWVVNATGLKSIELSTSRFEFCCWHIFFESSWHFLNLLGNRSIWNTVILITWYIFVPPECIEKGELCASYRISFFISLMGGTCKHPWHNNPSSVDLEVCLGLDPDVVSLWSFVWAWDALSVGLFGLPLLQLLPLCQLIRNQFAHVAPLWWGRTSVLLFNSVHQRLRLLFQGGTGYLCRNLLPALTIYVVSCSIIFVWTSILGFYGPYRFGSFRHTGNVAKFLMRTPPLSAPNHV